METMLAIVAGVCWLVLTYKFTQALLLSLGASLVVAWGLTHLLAAALAALGAAVIVIMVALPSGWIVNVLVDRFRRKKSEVPAETLKPEDKQKQEHVQMALKLGEWALEQIQFMQARKSEFKNKSHLPISVEIDLDMMALQFRHCVPEGTEHVLPYLFEKGVLRRAIDVSSNDYWLAYILREGVHDAAIGQSPLPITMVQLRAAEDKVRQELLRWLPNQEVLKGSPRELPPELLAECVLHGVVIFRKESDFLTGKTTVELSWNELLVQEQKVLKLTPGK